MMEAGIIIIIVGIVIYLIVQNNPNNKYLTAKKLIQRGKYADAQHILVSIFDKHRHAVVDYSECYCLIAKKIKSEDPLKAREYYEKAIASKSLLKENSDKAMFGIIEASAYYEIASINLQQILSEPKVNNIKNVIKKLRTNISYIKSSVIIGKEEEFRKLEIEHLNKISEWYYYEGQQNEKKGETFAALYDYNDALSSLKGLAKSPLYYDALFRKLICKLKSKEKVDLDEISELKTISHPFKTDFFYRYAVRLLNIGDYANTENILNLDLKTSHGEVDRLREICQNERLKRAIKEVETINNRIENLYSGKCSEQEAFTLYDFLTSRFDEITHVLPDITNQLSEIRPSLLNRLLISCFDNKQYINIIGLITEYPKFYESPVLMKNLGNACVNLVENGDLTEKNFKNIIALFLSSAYSDKVMVYSLSDTSWDDEYTFSLYDSIGSSFKFDAELPENINFSEPDENNISIGEAQRELIKQFEFLLNEKVINPKLSKQVHPFYIQEKEAIEQVISLIHNDILFTTPYFANTYNTSDNIITELENLYLQESNESALEVAVLYNNQNINRTVTRYINSQTIINSLLEAIQEGDLESFKINSSQPKLKQIFEFKSRKSIFEDDTVNAFHKKIEDDDEDENLIPFMKYVITISPTKDKLKFQYGNYVANLCIAKVNSNKMKNFVALNLMSDAYNAIPDNLRICKNLITLIKINIMDVLSERVYNSYEVYEIIDKIKSNRSQTFRQNSEELKEARQELFSQLPLDARRSITSGINLNDHGRDFKKALDYLAELSGSSGYTDPLAEFRRALNLP